MDVRGKLVELIAQKVCDTWSESCDEWLPHDCGKCYANDCHISELADHLIAHGVTVQEWISVKDRLPEIPEGCAESPEPVLYMMENTKTIYAGYYGEDGMWRDKYFRQYADSRNGVDADDVLCWMYQHDLPEPPKGE